MRDNNTKWYLFCLQATFLLLCACSVLPAIAVQPPGSAENGRALFTGTKHFQNGAPSCLACHGSGGVGTLGGGTLGPDLSGIYNIFGEDELNQILSTPPFPTMQPIYEKHPLTQEEATLLVAFFREVAAKSSKNVNKTIGFMSAGGLIVLIFLLSVIWRNRLKDVRKTLVRQSSRKEGF